MIKYRMEITKGEAVRYISHLDFAGLMQRAVCRSGLPAAYSEGFNPHMKIAFASALGVGITSAKEYMDLELTKDICQPEVFDKLKAVLPPGVELLKLKEVPLKAKALMSVVDQATYEVVIPWQGDADELAKAVKVFNDAKEISIIRQTPKKTKEVEIKQYIAEPVKYKINPEHICFDLSIKITPSGTTKPNEILEVLRDKYGLELDLAEVMVCRTGLYHQGKALIDIE